MLPSTPIVTCHQIPAHKAHYGSAKRESVNEWDNEEERTTERGKRGKEDFGAARLTMCLCEF